MSYSRSRMNAVGVSQTPSLLFNNLSTSGDKVVRGSLAPLHQTQPYTHTLTVFPFFTITNRLVTVLQSYVHKDTVQVFNEGAVEGKVDAEHKEIKIKGSALVLQVTNAIGAPRNSKQ